jgi:hypothetical protein
MISMMELVSSLRERKRGGEQMNTKDIDNFFEFWLSYNLMSVSFLEKIWFLISVGSASYVWLGEWNYLRLYANPFLERFLILGAWFWFYVYGAYCKNSDCAFAEIGKFRLAAAGRVLCWMIWELIPPTALDDTVFRWSVKELIAPKEFV